MERVRDQVLEPPAPTQEEEEANELLYQLEEQEEHFRLVQGNKQAFESLSKLSAESYQKIMEIIDDELTEIGDNILQMKLRLLDMGYAV